MTTLADEVEVTTGRKRQNIWLNMTNSSDLGFCRLWNEAWFDLEKSPKLAKWKYKFCEGRQAHRELESRGFLLLVRPAPEVSSLFEQLGLELRAYREHRGDAKDLIVAQREAIEALRQADARLKKGLSHYSKTLVAKPAAAIKECLQRLEKSRMTWAEKLEPWDRSSWLLDMTEDEDGYVRRVPPAGVSEWQEFFAQFPEVALQRAVQFETRFQLRVALIFKRFLPISIRTVARLVVLFCWAAGIGTLRNDVLYVPEIAKPLTVGGVDQKFRDLMKARQRRASHATAP